MEWISVKDRLPESSDYIVVIVKEESKPIVGFYCQMDHEWIVSAYGSNTPGEEFHDDEDITHWMPLPKSPKE